MYEEFNPFLDVETWHTRHAEDEERFFRALRRVVGNPRFNPDEMGEHMRARLRVDRNDDENPFNEAIDHYVAAAWAVRTFLRTPE